MKSEIKIRVAGNFGNSRELTEEMDKKIWGILVISKLPLVYFV
ncbi:unnamed protein product [Tenebrio molitor]|nr:unnamed protein product [Tenebrio molitor]